MLTPMSKRTWLDGWNVAVTMSPRASALEGNASMEIIIQPSAMEVAHLAARIIARLVHRKPHAVLGLATGTTPLTIYAELVRMQQQGELDLRRIITFNLDEFVGL